VTSNDLPAPGAAFDAVEFATLEWVDCFNHRRLLEPIGYVPPSDFEAMYHGQEQPAEVGPHSLRAGRHELCVIHRFAAWKQISAQAS